MTQAQVNVELRADETGSSEVERARQRLNAIEERIQPGSITIEELEELADAYEAYIKVRAESPPPRSGLRGLLHKLVHEDDDE